MAETGRIDPFSDVISLISGPIAAVIRSFDQLRKGSEELMRGLENFNRTMINLNETAERINRLLNEFEEPIRAMVPQLTRTVKLADEMSLRLATPIDQVVPGLARLAETLNSPVLRSLPTDLRQFLEVINDLSRRMAPLAQLGEQAVGMFGGLRIPGLTRPVPAAPAAPAAPQPVAAPPPTPEPAAPSAAPATTARAKKAAPRKAPATRRATAKKAPAEKAPAKRAPAEKSPARKSAARTAPAKKAPAKKRAAKASAPTI